MKTLEEIREARKAYEEEYERIRSIVDGQSERYEAACNKVERSVENSVREIINAPEFIEVSVRTYKLINCNYLDIKFADAEHNVSWEVDINYDRKLGTCKKYVYNMNFYGDFSHHTSKVIGELSYIIDRLSDVDWVSVLNYEYPKVSDYIDSSIEYPEKPNFDALEKELICNDIIGKDKWISADAKDSYGMGGNGYFKIISETPKRFKVAFVHRCEIESADARSLAEKYPFVISKNTLYKGVNLNTYMVENC